jgi:hypothetical protein
VTSELKGRPGGSAAQHGDSRHGGSRHSGSRDGGSRDGAAVGDAAGLASELAAALNRDGPTVIDASIDPATYLAVMDLTRGEAGRHPRISQRLSGALPPPTGHDPSTGT